MCFKLNPIQTTVHRYPKQNIADQATKIAVLYAAAAPQPQLYPHTQEKNRDLLWSSSC